MSSQAQQVTAIVRPLGMQAAVAAVDVDGQVEHEQHVSNSQNDDSELRMNALIQRLSLGYMCVALVLAAALNVYVLVRLVDKLRRNVGNRRNLLLKLHLNLSDVLICALFVLPRIIWGLTHEFLGGRLMCKTIMFGIVFSFVLSSSILAAIGIDRLWGIVYPFGAQHVGVQRVKWLIGLSWLYSVLFALPQAATWDLVQVNNETHCASVFAIYAHAPATDGLFAGVSNSSMAWLEDLWSWVHMTSSIYVPGALILLCYAVMMQQVCWHLVCSKQADPEDGSAARKASSDSTSSCRTTRSTHHTLISRDVCVQMVQKARITMLQATTAATIRSNRSVLMRQATATGASSATVRAISELQRKNTTSSIQSQQQQSSRMLHRMNTASSLVVSRLRTIRHPRGGQSIRTSIKMLKTALILITAYIVCWAPYAVFNVLTTLDQQFSAANHWRIDQATKNWLIANSVINPLLYGFQRKDMRQLARRLRHGALTLGRCMCCFCCICCKLFTYDWDESSDAD